LPESPFEPPFKGRTPVLLGSYHRLLLHLLLQTPSLPTIKQIVLSR